MGAAAIPLVLMAAATAVQTVGTLRAGTEAANAARSERAQYEEEAETARVGALIDENARRKQLQQTLAAQSVYFAANGLDPNSATSQALRDESIGLAEDDIQISNLNYANRRNQALMSAAQAGRNAKAARTGSLWSAAGGLLQAGAKMSSMGMGGPAKPDGPPGMYNGGTGGSGTGGVGGVGSGFRIGGV